MKSCLILQGYLSEPSVLYRKVGKEVAGPMSASQCTRAPPPTVVLIPKSFCFLKSHFVFTCMCARTCGCTWRSEVFPLPGTVGASSGELPYRGAEDRAQVGRRL